MADGIGGDGEDLLQRLAAAPLGIGNLYPAGLEVGSDELQCEIAECHLLPVSTGCEARKPETGEYQF